VSVKAVEINENLSSQAKSRIKSVNEAIDSNWNDNAASKQQAILNSKKYFEQFGNPETTEPYLVPWFRPGNLDQSEM
jgi:hypothetical protein